MQLLNVKSHPLRLQEFRGGKIPPYLILSHTWAVDPNDEILFQDVIQPGQRYLRKRAWYNKIRGFCQMALSIGYEWVWIDTCCIDKSSSADLTEAINSMYRWYQTSDKCAVYLEDFWQSSGVIEPFYIIQEPEEKPKWFTRGWTLQELLAPRHVDFYDARWDYLGNKKTLAHLIRTFTQIPITALSGQDAQSFTIEERLSWAHGRQTTRPEDRAYSLMGLLDVSMPAVYGEGKIRALRRLKKEIEAYKSDQRSSLGYLAAFVEEPAYKHSERAIKVPAIFSQLKTRDWELSYLSTISLPSGYHRLMKHKTSSTVSVGFGFTLFLIGWSLAWALHHAIQSHFSFTVSVVFGITLFLSDWWLVKALLRSTQSEVSTVSVGFGITLFFSGWWIAWVLHQAVRSIYTKYSL